MTTKRIDPPYEIHGEGLVLRCWQPADAPALKDAIDASLDHLRAWMPWANAEPTTMDEKVEQLRGFRGSYDLGRDFVMGIFDPSQQRVLGGTGLHPRGGPRTLEIGYWVRADEVRQGIATRACRMLVRTAFDWCGVERLDVKVEPSNVASCAVPRRLGFVEEGVRRGELDDHADGPLRDAVMFTMLRSEFESNPASDVDVRWFDATGVRVERQLARAAIRQRPAGGPTSDR